MLSLVASFDASGKADRGGGVDYCNSLHTLYSQGTAERGTSMFVCFFQPKTGPRREGREGRL